MTAVRDVVATLNMRVDLPNPVAANALAVLTSPIAGVRVDLVGLQEWGPNRNTLLRARGRLRRFPKTDRVARPWRRKWTPSPGYVFTRPLLGPSGPVGARRDRYELLGCKAKLLAGPAWLDPVPGLRRFKGPNYATVATFRDHLLDETVAVVNYHLSAHVQAGRGGWLPGRPKRVARHIRERAKVNTIVTRRLTAGQTVYAVGDSNEHGHRIPGLSSAYDGRPGFPGTYKDSPRRIDDVHGPGNAETVHRIDVGSDHWLIVAVRRRVKRARR